VHRGWPTPPDVSADLQALATTQVLVVSSGVKSLLDVPATSELLETHGVPVLGYQTDDLPLFYAAHGGPPVSARVESAREAARIARAHWRLGGGGLLVGRPPDDSLDDVEPLIEEALAAAEREHVHGQAVTPFVLSYLHRESGGRTLAANRELIVGNARLAGEIASAASDAVADHRLRRLLRRLNLFDPSRSGERPVGNVSGPPVDRRSGASGRG
ncbi:MAG TPA: pseudouridine-5'-phosphate glycosidase, partial [Gaiellaceae bacterium]